MSKKSKKELKPALSGVGKVDLSIGWSLEDIAQTLSVYVCGFSGITSEPDRYDAVKRYYDRTLPSLNSVGNAMTTLLTGQDGDLDLLTSLADRMRACSHMRDRIRLNIALEDRGQWSWGEIIAAMTFIESVLFNFKLCLQRNGVDL